MFSCQILKMSRDGEWGFHDVSGQPVTVLNHCLREEHFPYDQFELPFLQTVITIHCALTVHLSEEARFVLSTTLFSIALTRWLKRAIRIFLFSPYFPYPLKGHMLQLLTILLTSLWTHSQNWRLLQMQPHKCQAEVNHHFLWPTFDTSHCCKSLLLIQIDFFPTRTARSFSAEPPACTNTWSSLPCVAFCIS